MGLPLNGSNFANALRQRQYNPIHSVNEKGTLLFCNKFSELSAFPTALWLRLWSPYLANKLVRDDNIQAKCWPPLESPHLWLGVTSHWMEKEDTSRSFGFLRILEDQEAYCEIPGDIEVIGMKGWETIGLHGSCDFQRDDRSRPPSRGGVNPT